VNTPAKHLFRPAAIEHYRAEEELGGLVKLSPPGAWGLAAAATATVGILAGSIWGSIEIRGRAPGILCAAEGVPSLTARDAPRPTVAQPGPHVVAFLPEKDRPFLNEHDRVRLNFAPRSAGHLTVLEGHIVRVGDSLASATELRDAIGHGVRIDGPTCRIEIRLDRPSEKDAGGLRAGMLMDVHYTIRRRRLITLLAEPLSRWLH
jgi:hypothetical protein